MVNKISLFVSIIIVIAVGTLVFLLFGAGNNLIRFSPSPFNVSVQVGNSPPVVNLVSFTNQPAVVGGVQPVLINFTVRDSNLVTDLNDSTARVEIYNLSLTGDVRVNSTCDVVVDLDADTRNYNCAVGMWYFDPYGMYTVNVTIRDNAGARAENSSRIFQYIATPSAVIYPNALSWDPIAVEDVDKPSNNDPLISNNTGNVDFNTLTLTAFNLPGSITSNKFIYAGNFSVNVADNCLGGDMMANNTGVGLSGGALLIGNLSSGGGIAQENLYFCIKAINSDTPAETFSSSNTGGIAWNLDFS